MALIAIVGILANALAGNTPLVATVIYLLGFLGCVAWGRFAFNFNRKIWPRAMASWDEKFICARCARVFKPSNTGARAAA
jgi:hypothetical protein